MAGQGLILALYREAAPGRYHRRCLWQQLRQTGIIQRRRHDQQFQIVAQPLLYVQQQRQRQIGLQAALVEFVEDHQ
ncbi:hypothetical protein D3C79_580560 [compost metagenome]